MFEIKYRKLVRLSAVYDVFATAAFATPWTFHLLHQTLGVVSPLPVFEPMHILFVNLLGCLVLVWSALRILRPEPIFGAFDSVARGLFFFWQVYYLLIFSISPVVWIFSVFEFAFGISQAYGYWLLYKVSSGVPSNCKVVNYFATAA